MTNAIIKTGGKQFSVETGQTLRVPSISDKNEGDKVDIEALFVNTDGKINLGGATVKATIVGHGRADKIIVFKKKRRKQYKRKQGHRQGFTEITIDKIQLRSVRIADCGVWIADYKIPNPKSKIQNPKSNMAHKKGVGSSRNGRDSNSQRLGLKKFGGEKVLGGNILARQRGTKWKPGKNVGIGKDDTLFSLIEGFVKFENKGQKGKFISVYLEGATELAPKAA